MNKAIIILLNFALLTFKNRLSMRVFIQLIFLLLLLFSCATRSQKDYVKLVIPESLKNNKVAVEKLQEDAEQLNKVFNSMDDLFEDILSIREDLEKFDSTSSYTWFEIKMNYRKIMIQKSFAKIAFNVMWYAGKDILSGDTIMITKMNEGDRVIYKKCLMHISLQKDLLSKRFDEISAGMDSLNKELDEKMPLLKKMKNEHLKATEKDSISLNK